MSVTLINFSHPITDVQRFAVESFIGRPIERIIEKPIQFDNALPFAEQARLAMTGVRLTNAEWQTSPVVVNLPSFSPVAGLILAELHGRMGYFPPILRLRPVGGETPQRYEVAEILNLQEVRDAARVLRQTPDTKVS
jgi:hypothetical protein